jgi:Ser/Thr protein kinase RdoA (MazF antagonist)
MHPSFERGIHLLRSSVASSKPAQISWLHGDCKTDNFMLSRGRVYGIDIHVEHENAIEHDLAQFLNNVALQTLRLRFRHLKPIAPALTDAFMSGYRSAGPEVSARLLHWIRLWSAISYWHSSVAEHRPAWATRWVLNRMFSALVGELIAAQGQAESDRIKP